MEPTLISLHRHWCRADSIKHVLFAPEADSKDMPRELHDIGVRHSQFLRLEVLYGLIYVVIEGYQDLEIGDKAIDELLKNAEALDALRRFRNGVFHYQKDPISLKLLGFLTADKTEDWIRSLHKAFDSFFMRVLPIQELVAEFRDVSTE
jgi:hypothetical protein